MIQLKINIPKFENDVRALLMAFFPGEKISVADVKTTDYFLNICFEQVTEEAPFGTEIFCEFFENGTLVTSGRTVSGRDEQKWSRDQLKRLVYKLLCESQEHTLPWGTLTGIRPTKTAMEFLEKGMSEEDLYAYFKETFKISDEKYRLCTQVARNEKKILENIDYKHSYSLYAGIPFCPTICAYCSFSSYPLKVWKNQVDDYLGAMFREIEVMSGRFADKQLLSFYMGGGTPTSLTARQMDGLLTKLEQCFHIERAKEITIEAGRPDSITPDKLKVIKAHGIDRISINPQTMNQKTLDAIGRRHTVDEVYKAYAMARDAGFNNINMDLIAGLPGETYEDFCRTTEAIRRLEPESLTVHALAIKRAAALNKEETYRLRTGVAETNAMISEGFRAAASMGMAPYYMYRQKNIAGNLENVGYAKPGKEGLYNMLIMEEKQSILAIGAGASTKMVIHDENRIERIENVKSVKDYIERIDEMIGRKDGIERLVANRETYGKI